MKILTFKRGGVHPADSKFLSRHQPIRTLPLPDEVHISLNQHLGKPAKPMVQLRREVAYGDKIGAADGFISADVHSSVSGKVKKIVKKMTAVGNVAETVIISVDKDKTREDMLRFQTPATKDWQEKSVSELLEDVKSAGIVGMGGATFPTHVKLSPPPDREIDLIIINGAECEPFLTADHQLMLEKARNILTGIRIVSKILGTRSVFIGIEDNKPDAVAEFRKLLESESQGDIRLAVLKTQYPQGGEKQLICAVSGREVPSGKLPFDVGALVLNVGTVFAIYEAVVFGKPLVERVTTVSGFVNRPGNYLLPVGTTFDYALNEAAQGFQSDSAVRKILNGGPMMGKAVRQLDVSVMKGTSGILAFSENDAVFHAEGPCIRCGRCVSVCPMGLLPTNLALGARFQSIEHLKNVMDCIECGSCSFICPTHRALVHWIRLGKTIFRAAQRRK